MKILVQQALIYDSDSPHHGSKQDILIENGVIRDIGVSIHARADRNIQEDGLAVSPGWVDIFSHFCDPGLEFKETLESGSLAAASGGYTEVFLVPNTRPVVDNKTQVEYIRRQSGRFNVELWPIGALTKNGEGKDLAEMYDMHGSGAIAFGDGTNPVQSAGVLLKALQYVRAFDGVIIQVPDDRTLGSGGLINEGIVSTRLGLPGKPAIAEELMIARDIKLVRYAESRIHFTGVSSPLSLEYIRQAKQGGEDVTCSVTPYHLYFSDEDLQEYDTNLKVYPPLRSREMTDRLRASVSDGTIDCIASHHFPHESDSKNLEFENAQFGMTGLETTYSVLKTLLPELAEETWVNLLCVNPRRIFRMAQPRIEKGQACNMTLFNPKASRIFQSAAVRSKSRNSPFLGKELRGKVLGIINGDQLFLNS